MNYANRTGDSKPARILRAVEGRSNSLTQSGGGQDLATGMDSHQIELFRNQTAMIAAADGDVVALKRLLDSGLDVNYADYDRRTALTVSS